MSMKRKKVDLQVRENDFEIVDNSVITLYMGEII